MLQQSACSPKPPRSLAEILVEAKGAAQALFHRLVAVEDLRAQEGSVGSYDLKDKRLVSDVESFLARVESLCKRPDFGSDRTEAVSRVITALRQKDCFATSLSEALEALSDSDVDFFQKGAAATQVINAVVHISMLVQGSANARFVKTLSFEEARELTGLGNEITQALRSEAGLAKPMTNAAQKARAMTGELLIVALEGGVKLSSALLDQLTELRALTLSVHKMVSSKGVNRDVQEAFAAKLRRKLTFS
jgi:hypothetical protein